MANPPFIQESFSYLHLLYHPYPENITRAISCSNSSSDSWPQDHHLSTTVLTVPQWSRSITTPKNHFIHSLLMNYPNHKNKQPWWYDITLYSHIFIKTITQANINLWELTFMNSTVFHALQREKLQKSFPTNFIICFFKISSCHEHFSFWVTDLYKCFFRPNLIKYNFKSSNSN